MHKIIIAEDHKIFNDGLKALLSPIYQVILQIFDGRQVIHALQKERPQMLITDINLPGENGLDLGKKIIAGFPSIKLVYLSMYNEPAFVKTAKEIGAHGYLLKDSPGHEILTAVSEIFEGKTVFDPKINNTKQNLHHNDYFVKNFALSKREVEVISLIRQGHSTDDIAKRLFVSYETVKSHRKNIFFKLGIKKVSELIQFAIKYEI